MQMHREAYEAYARHTGWKSLASGQQLPPWDDLSKEIKEAWLSSTTWVLGKVMMEKLIENRDNIRRTHLLPREVAEQLGVGIEPVLNWIRSGQLKASNVSNSPLRPRWRIAKDDLQVFLNRRSNHQKSSETQPRRRPIPKPSKEYV